MEVIKNGINYQLYVATCKKCGCEFQFNPIKDRCYIRKVANDIEYILCPECDYSIEKDEWRPGF